VEATLRQNYIELHESSGEPYESIAGRVESMGDTGTAAELRALAAGDAPEAVTEPPKERRAGNKPVTAEAS
jgi:hypothetical protein